MVCAVSGSQTTFTGGTLRRPVPLSQPTYRLASQAVIARFAFANDLESTIFQSREMSLKLRTTSDNEVVPEVVLCGREIRRRQPGRRDGSTGA